jgi:hypothetical protein
MDMESNHNRARKFLEQQGHRVASVDGRTFVVDGQPLPDEAALIRFMKEHYPDEWRSMEREFSA